jgi:type VI secretion system ImpB/VipA family protein
MEYWNMGSFQREIPKAGVQITLDLHTGGAQKKIELPLKLLVAGDFSCTLAVVSGVIYGRSARVISCCSTAARQRC